jgi:hypothetical protein
MTLEHFCLDAVLVSVTAVIVVACNVAILGIISAYKKDTNDS